MRRRSTGQPKPKRISGVRLSRDKRKRAHQLWNLRNVSRHPPTTVVLQGHGYKAEIPGNGVAYERAPHDGITDHILDASMEHLEWEWYFKWTRHRYSDRNVVTFWNAMCNMVLTVMDAEAVLHIRSTTNPAPDREYHSKYELAAPNTIETLITTLRGSRYHSR